MIRLFNTNEIRKVTELDGMWDFALLSDEYTGNPVYSYRLPVPGCWEMHPDLLTYRGQGIYRKTVTVQSPTSLRLVFKGVSHTAKVFFDGQFITSHYNAYTAFNAYIRDVEPGEHELTIQVDNSFGDHSTLHIPNDYYTYGGIIRPVLLEEYSAYLIERIEFTPFLKGDIWHADVKVVVMNDTGEEPEINLIGELAGVSLKLGQQKANAQGRTILHGEFAFPEVESWSFKNPSLYLLKAHLYIADHKVPVDDLIERVGFREVATHEGKIQVNGQDVVLKGFNRHEDHPHAGASLPLQLMMNDLELIAATGANTVRTSHYPNDERFLDLCDEKGLLVWEENHARGLSLEQMQKSAFSQQCETVNREMVEQHFNHPSIIIWGILNECSSDTAEGREMYQRQLNQIRNMDSSRPLTFASNKRENDICLDLVDIVSFNLYPGWYGDEKPEELSRLVKVWTDQNGGNERPIIISEFGADGYYGYRDPSRVKGTEERQVDIIEANLLAYETCSFISGMLIWQFSDCRITEGTGWLMSRAGTQNSKGLVDRYRRPKLAYDFIKNHWKKGDRPNI